MPTSPLPSKRLPAARRRKQLVDVALALFGSGSYHATSMDDIAEGAGVTKPVLYQHFPSKSQLYLELIKTVGDELAASVASSAGAESQPYARVLAGFRAYFSFVGRRTDAFRLLFGGGARQDAESAEAVSTVERTVAATIGDLIDVELDDEHRELIGYAVVGLAEVTSRQWVLRHLDGGAIPLDPAEGELLARRLADLIWAGLRGLPGLTSAAD